jgi:hypothetical protein
MSKNIYIFTGGTSTQIAPHFSISSEAYGSVGSELESIFNENNFLMKGEYSTYLINTDMSLRSNSSRVLDHLNSIGLDSRMKIRSNQDVATIVDRLVELEETKCIVMACALCDYKPHKLSTSSSWDEDSPSDLIHNFKDGRITKRLHKVEDLTLDLKPADKIINRIRKKRKDIFLISFKATTDETPRNTYIKALYNLKASSSNLVLANDIVNGYNMVVTPEEFPYHASNRSEALNALAKISLHRMRCHFTRSEVVDADLIPWRSNLIPSNLRTVVDYCIDEGAYKPFRGATVGHFACRGDGDSIYTSVRKSNFCSIDDGGLVKIEAVDDTKVIAYGAKPSVGGQSQRIIFKEHAEKDCIVHFHCPVKENAEIDIPIRPQWQNECGSHECGQNTSDGLVEVVPGIKAVMLENHGPNIVFSKDEDPNKVIKFINSNFSLLDKTGGEVEFDCLFAM